MNYVYLVYAYDPKKVVKQAIIGLKQDFDLIESYKDPAIEKLCNELGYNTSDVHAIEFRFLGDKVDII